MGGAKNHRRLARSMAVALVLAAVGAVAQLSGLPGASLTGSAQAQIPPREAPQISALSQPTTSSIAVIWLPADNTDVHWLYAVKADGTGGRFQLAVPDPVQGASGQQGVTGTARTTTVSGLDAGTQYWFAILGVRAPSDGSPDTWFRWSNWGRASTLTTPTVSVSADVTVAEGGTATLTVTAAPAPPSAPLTVNYAIGADADPATVDGDGSDYTGMATGSISIAAGATQGSIADRHHRRQRHRRRRPRNAGGDHLAARGVELRPGRPGVGHGDHHGGRVRPHGQGARRDCGRVDQPERLRGGDGRRPARPHGHPRSRPRRASPP